MTTRKSILYEASRDRKPIPKIFKMDREMTEDADVNGRSPMETFQLQV